MLLEGDEVAHGGWLERRQQTHLGHVGTGRDGEQRGVRVEQLGQAATLGEESRQGVHTGQWAEIAVLVDDGHLMLVVVFVRGETHGRAPVGVEAWHGSRGRGGRSGHDRGTPRPR